jgi:hypothetical protein
MGEEAQQKTEEPTRKVLIDTKELPRDQCLPAAYINKAGVLYMPSTWILAMLREAGSQHKMKGSRKSVKYLVPAAVVVSQYEIPLLSEEDVPLTDFEVDRRPVRIRATGGRIMRYRPRLDQWRAKFDLEIDEEILPENMIHTLLSDGGRKIGIGDFRPSCGGPFGRFKLIQWDRAEKPACDDEVAAE